MPCVMFCNFDDSSGNQWEVICHSGLQEDEQEKFEDAEGVDGREPCCLIVIVDVVKNRDISARAWKSRFPQTMRSDNVS